MISEAPKPPTSGDRSGATRPETPVIDIRDLLSGGREAIILHGGERYRLRVTAKDKLILTK
jgi:hemin uptake protein HemP